MGCTESDKEMFGDCFKSAMRTKSIEAGLNFGEILGKPCVVLEIVEECLASINGNCSTDPFFSMRFSQLQQECDLEKSGECVLNRTESRSLGDCAEMGHSTRTATGGWIHKKGIK